MSGDRRDSTAPLPDVPADDTSVPNVPSRRAEERIDVTWAVDCKSEDTFLYAYITNVSAMGLFVRTDHPLAIGTKLHLAFSTEGTRPFELLGEVAWINPHHEVGRNLNPGMGIRFLDLHPDDRERLVEAIRTIAYVRSDVN